MSKMKKRAKHDKKSDEANYTLNKKSEKNSQKLSNSYCKNKQSSKKYYLLIFIILVLFFFITFNSQLLKWLSWSYENHQWDSEVLDLFTKYDDDHDNYLSLNEFAALLRNGKVLLKNSKPHANILTIDPDDEVITIQAFFISLNRSSMTKDLRTNSYSLPLQGLLEWIQPHATWKNFAVRHFTPFVPKNVHLGYTWFLLKSSLTMFISQLSSNRYYPPLVSDEELIFHELLSIFHPHPFIYTRFAPQGGIAIVRAINDRMVDVVFRIHAEYQLNDPPLYPFWFTPAQFTGNIIFSRDFSKIQFFQMYVPNDRSLNVDMEWLNGPGENENMEVDIGFMPLMLLNSTSPSVPVVLHHNGSVEYLNESFIHGPDNYESILESFTWKEKMTLKDAQNILRKEIYPFTQIEYVPFEDAFLQASAENKLVHSILLWGALDDQSC